MSGHAVLFDNHLTREAGRDFTGLLVKGGIANHASGALVTVRERLLLANDTDSCNRRELIECTGHFSIDPSYT